MLLKVESRNSNGSRNVKNMHVTRFTEMSLFKTAFNGTTVTVSYSGPNDSLPETSIPIPLQPDMASLQTVDVEMHTSLTTALLMGGQYDEWFTEQFGYEVLLAYIGPKRRPILGSFLPPASSSATGILSSWLPSVFAGKQDSPETTGITFADCANFLVVTEESHADASSRLPDGIEMDIKKFRPNIVVSGSLAVWDEDFWAGLHIKTGNEGEVGMPLTANCIRCASINIDYSTGKPGIGEDGKMLKKLMKDRRVDKGAKYSPVFGRYGYLGKGLGKSISVGDEVVVTKRLEERSIWGEWVPYSVCEVTNEYIQTGQAWEIEAGLGVCCCKKFLCQLHYMEICGISRAQTRDLSMTYSIYLIWTSTRGNLN